jgi:prepilin-type N-terminal cleavage/methylation domain-containing protein
MTNKVSNNKKGFTIIEVVLVLAVAALIFLIVFLAVPALQRSRRDTARKNDVGRAIAQLESYASSHNGEYPSNVANFNLFKVDFLDNFADPGKGSYTVVGTTPAAEGQLQYQRNGKCDANNKIVSGGGTRYVAISVKLEQGGTYCKGNK